MDYKKKKKREKHRKNAWIVRKKGKKKQNT